MRGTDEATTTLVMGGDHEEQHFDRATAEIQRHAQQTSYSEDDFDIGLRSHLQLVRHPVGEGLRAPIWDRVWIRVFVLSLTTMERIPSRTSVESTKSMVTHSC